MRLSPLLLALPLWISACSDKADDTGGNGGNGGDTDSGDSGDTGVDYEEGCITVDGAGGYAHLADAVTVASEGASIWLCNGEYPESVEVTKAVTITGESRDGVILVGQGTDPALRISADNVTVGTMTVQGTYSGVVIGAVAGAMVSDVTFNAPEYWGLQAQNADGATVSACSFITPGAGGVQVGGGSVTVSGSTFDNPTSYAFDVTNGAEVTLTDNTVDGVVMLSEDVTDGIALNLIESTAHLSGNVFDTPQGMGIFSDTSTLTTDGDTISGQLLSGAPYVGIFAVDTDCDLVGLTIQNVFLQGAYLVGSTVSVSDSIVSVEEDPANEYTYADWNSNGNPWFGAYYIIADTISITNTQVSGYNNYGVLLAPYAADTTGLMTVDGLTIDSVGRRAMWVESGDLTANNLSITNLREPELAAPCISDPDQPSSYTVDVSVGLFLYETNATFTGATFANNQGWGISSYTSTIDMGGSTIDGNVCSGIINFSGVLSLHDSQLHHASSAASIWDYQGVTVLTGNTFSDNQTPITYGPYDDGAGGTYSYQYSQGGGQDVNASSGDITAVGNTFIDGDRSISLYESKGDIHDNTWTGYDGYAVAVSSSPSGQPTVFDDNTIDDHGGSALNISNADMDINNLTLGTMRMYSYEYSYYEDDVLVYTATSSSYSPAIYEYGSSAAPSNVVVDGIEAAAVPYGLLYLYEASSSLYDVHITSGADGGGYPLVYGTWSSTEPVIDIDGFSADTVGAYGGLSLTNSGLGAAYVTLNDLTFGTVAGSSVQLTGMNSVTISNADLGTPSGYGLYSHLGATSTGVVALSNVTVSGASNYGISLYGGNATLSDVTATEGSSTGLSLDTITATVQGNTFTNNGQYGMMCSTTTLTACSDNTLTGNTLGEHSGCDDACGQPAGGGDTGTGDTGI